MLLTQNLQKTLTGRFPGIRFYENNAEEILLGFAIYTRQCAHKCKIGQLKECLDTADDLYQHGCSEIQQAVKLVYMPAIKNMMERNCTGGKLLKMYLPFSLYQVYVALMYKV